MKIENNNAGDFDRNPPVKVNQYDESMRKYCAAYEDIFRMAHAYLMSIIEKDSELLIVGAGTGAELCQFGQGKSEWKMMGVDPSEEMLAIATNKIKHLNTENIQLFHGYTSDLEASKQYDAATCILVMHFLEDDGSKLQLLKDIGGKLKKGAPFIVVDAFGDKMSPSFLRNLEAWKKYVVLNGVEETIVEDGFQNQILPRLKFITEERMQELFWEAGFEYGNRFYTSFLYGGWILRKR